LPDKNFNQSQTVLKRSQKKVKPIIKGQKKAKHFGGIAIRLS